MTQMQRIFTDFSPPEPLMLMHLECSPDTSFGLQPKLKEQIYPKSFQILEKSLPLHAQILSVAQLVEQLTLNQWVPGSNPGGETGDKCKV
jgi:hypothetical protein